MITTTTTAVDGVTFDTVLPAGTTPVITLDAKLNGVEDPTYLFFVQNGQINGNYTGQLTDPLMLEPSPCALTLRAVVGFGANLGDRLATMRAALAALARVAHVEGTSHVYATAPVGPPQPEYLNAAALVAWEGTAEGLLDALLAIEAKLGRVRAERFGPRTVDLDVLWIEGLAAEGARLVVPHPRLRERAFAVVPCWRSRRTRATRGRGRRTSRRRVT